MFRRVVLPAMFLASMAIVGFGIGATAQACGSSPYVYPAYGYGAVYATNYGYAPYGHGHGFVSYGHGGGYYHGGFGHGHGGHGHH